MAPFGNTSGDFDWYKVPTVTTGQVIQVEVIAAAVQSQGFVDTVVSIYDQNGILVDTDDDGGVGTDSRLNYTATADGDYFVVVYGKGNGEPLDPNDSSSGAGAGSTGFYDVRIGLESRCR